MNDREIPHRACMTTRRAAKRVAQVINEVLERRQLMSGYTYFTNTANFAAPLNAAPIAGLVVGADQNLYGSTLTGGTYNDGTIFELNSSGGAFTTLVNFNSSGGYNPYAAMTLGSDGNLYGSTESGGTNGDGTLFRLNTSSHILTTIFSFNGSNGASPLAALTKGSGTSLYGTTALGGSSNTGTVFNFNTADSSLVTMVNLNSSTGTSPHGAIVVGSDQNLYGTTPFGGSSNYGTIFEINSKTNVLTTLVNFNLSNGAAPYGGLVTGADQNFYGTTGGGGSSGGGTVFELTGTTNVLTTLINFNASSTLNNSADPQSALVIGPDGNFYGTSYSGGVENELGTVFKVDGSTHALSTIYQFDGPGYWPEGPLTVGPDKYLYGTTYSGGNGNFGTVFKINPSTNGFTTLANFNASTGENPRAPLVAGSDQNLYGATYDGGVNNYGTVFELNSSNHAVTTLAIFNSSNGANPYAGLITGPDQNLYGTTSMGGDYDRGTIFEINITSHVLTTVVNFNFSTGSQPEAALLVGPDNNFYGTTYAGIQSGGYGTVFELTSATHTLTTIASFSSTTGTHPESSLILGPDKNFYGTTYSGGTSNDGTFFRVNASNHALTTLINFNSSTAYYPTTGVILGPDQNFYGTTAGGGDRVFEINSSTYALTTVFYTYGYLYMGLSIGPDQNLYCTASANSGDSIFEIDKTTHAATTLLGFTSAIGAGLNAPLVIGADQNLYGTASAGGIGFGTVFELSKPPSLNVTTGTTTLPALTGAGLADKMYSSITIAAGAKLAVGLPMYHDERLIITTDSLNLSSNGSSWTSSVDLGGSDMDIANGSLSTITSQITQGFANGTWAGENGIASSAAALDSTHLTALGSIQNNQGGAALFTSNNPFYVVAPGTSDILVKYTYYGDANLDGKVDGSDYSRIDSGYFTDATGWYNGDFNYDGVVNGSDYTLIDNAFNRQGASLAAEIVHVAKASVLVSSAAKPAAVFASDPSTVSADSGSPAPGIASIIFADGDNDFATKKLKLADKSLLF